MCAEDPTGAGNGDEQPPEGDEEQLDGASNADHEASQPRLGPDHDGHHARLEFGVPWVGSPVGVALGGDDRILGGPLTEVIRWANSIVLAGRDEEGDHPRVKVFTATCLVIRIAPGP